MAETPSEDFPGWTIDEFNTLTITVSIRDNEIRLATVTSDPETGLHETYIGMPVSRNQLGLHDFSQARARRQPLRVVVVLDDTIPLQRGSTQNNGGK